MWEKGDWGPAFGSGGTGTVYFDYVEQTISGILQGENKEDRGRTNFTVRGTMLMPGHTLVAGIDYEDAKLTADFHLSMAMRTDSTSWIKDEEGYTGMFHNRSPAAYLQDSWRLTERFTLNPGLRWSAQFLVGASGRTAQQITDEWQPRVGFSWQLGNEPKQRLFGSYGRFYQTLPDPWMRWEERRIIALWR